MDEQNLLTDPLTGLHSRSGMIDFLDRYDGSDSIQIYSVQLSRFGSVNNSVGYVLADKIITLTGNRLKKIFADAIMIGRTHGDHFALVFNGSADMDSIISQLYDFTQRPFAVGGEVIVLGVKVGIAVLGEASLNDSRSLLHASEVALSQCKRDGSKVTHFTQDLLKDAKQIHELENELRLSLANSHVALHQALHENEFELYYQPIINCKNNTIDAFEALIRWNHPTKGMISPIQFIPMAEQIKVMDVLGGWILKRAMLDASSWPLNASGERIGVSINLSPTQFIEEKILLDSVSTAIEVSGMEPQRVKLEITESTTFADNMISVVESLQNLGCKIALDDFGTGYSSLTQLNRIPLDYLKLDRSFIKDLDINDEAKRRLCERMSSAVMSLVDTFELIPIVEGVETAEQLAVVKGLGAELIQGYYYSKPLRFDEVKAFIESYH